MSRQDSQLPTENNEDEDAARSQRIAAMRELAGGDVSPSAITPDRANAHPTPKRRVPVLLVALTVIVLLASVGAA